MKFIGDFFDKHPSLSVIGIILLIFVLVGSFVTCSIYLDGCPTGYRMIRAPAKIRWVRPDGSYFETDGYRDECLKREVVK